MLGKILKNNNKEDEMVSAWDSEQPCRQDFFCPIEYGSSRQGMQLVACSWEIGSYSQV